MRIRHTSRHTRAISSSPLAAKAAASCRLKAGMDNVLLITMAIGETWFSLIPATLIKSNNLGL